eukprot:879540-Prorocentrum_minimum.AAC.2
MPKVIHLICRLFSGPRMSRTSADCCGYHAPSLSARTFATCAHESDTIGCSPCNETSTSNGGHGRECRERIDTAPDILTDEETSDSLRSGFPVEDAYLERRRGAISWTEAEALSRWYDQHSAQSQRSVLLG